MTQPRVFVNGVDDAGGESVQRRPSYEQTPYASVVLSLATVADDISPWGLDVTRRDMQLRSFWPTEPMLASAIYAIVARNAAFSWTLEGPPRTVAQVQEKLHSADNGNGWQAFTQKLTIDLLTSDNGCFIEIIRAGSSETSPVTGIAHMDSARCRRTGVPEWPVVYQDRWGTLHKLRPWQVIAWSEFPSPVETMNGVGLCAVSRVLRAAQYLRDIGVYQREKVAGRNPGALYLVGGVNTKFIDDAVQGAKNNADNRGVARYMLPVIVASVDPTATVSVEKIDLASLPDGFDIDKAMKWYITNLSLALGTDYQELAPQPGNGLGTATQSVVMDEKSRGKSAAIFMKGIEYLFNFRGIMPRNVTFQYDEPSPSADLQQAELKKYRADAIQIYVQTGVLTPEAARQQMLDDGDISPELFAALQTTSDLTGNAVASDSEQQEAVLPADPKGALVTPAAAVVPPAVGGKAADAEGLDFAEAERTAWEADYRSTMETALRRAFVPLRRAILDASGTKGLWPFRGVKDDNDDAMTAQRLNDALTDEEWWGAFRRGMVDGASRTFRLVATGAAEYNAALGLPVNMNGVNQAVLDLTRTYTDAWWAEIETSTRTAMRSALVNWQEGRLGAQGLPDLVDALTPWFGEARAARISATEITRMFTEGNLLAMESAGIEQVEFQTVRDELVCPQCSPLNGKRYARTEAPRPPLHVGCRCMLVGVANDQAVY